MSGEKIDKGTLEKAPEAVQGAVDGMVQEIASVDQGYVDAISKKAHAFIENNYTEEQRKNIYSSLRQDDKGDVYWQDGKDFVKLSLDEDGRLKKGVMRDAHDDGTYKEFKFGAKEASLNYNSREVQKEGNLVKEGVKIKTKGEQTTVKKRSSNSFIGALYGEKQVEKMQVTVKADGQVMDAYISSSQMQGGVLSGGFQYGKEMVHVSYSSDGKPIYVSDQTHNVGVSLIDGKAGVGSVMARAEFNETGQVEKITNSSSDVHVSRKEIGASYANASTTYNADGSMQHTEYALVGGISVGSVNVSVHTGVQNTLVTDAGISLYQKNNDLGLALGSGGTGVHYATEKTIADVSGNRTTEGKNIDMAYSLAEGRVDLGYGNHSNEVKDGVTQAQETKMGFSAGRSKVNVTAFSSNTSVDEQGNETSIKKGFIAGYDVHDKEAKVASYTKKGEKSYVAQIYTKNGIGGKVASTKTMYLENGERQTQTKEANIGISASDVATDVLAGKDVATISKDALHVSMKVENKLTRDVQKHAEAVGVDTKDVVEAQQKFEKTVDERDEAKVKENTNRKNNDMAMAAAVTAKQNNVRA